MMEAQTLIKQLDAREARMLELEARYGLGIQGVHREEPEQS